MLKPIKKNLFASRTKLRTKKTSSDGKKRRNIITKMYRYYSDRWGKATKKQQISERMKNKKRNLYLRKSLLQNVKQFAVTILPLSNEWNFVGYDYVFLFHFSTDNNWLLIFCLSIDSKYSLINKTKTKLKMKHIIFCSW